MNSTFPTIQNDYFYLLGVFVFAPWLRDQIVINASVFNIVFVRWCFYIVWQQRLRLVADSKLGVLCTALYVYACLFISYGLCLCLCRYLHWIVCYLSAIAAQCATFFEPVKCSRLLTIHDFCSAFPPKAIIMLSQHSFIIFSLFFSTHKSHTCGKFTVTPNTHDPLSGMLKMNEWTDDSDAFIDYNKYARVCLCAVNAAKRSVFIESNENPLTAHQHVVTFCYIIIC